MSGTDPGDDPSLPLSQIERVVATCDRFEAAWRAGQRPRVEDYLGDLPDPDRPALLRELLALELVYRHLSEEVLEKEEFRRRFPGHDAVVDSVFPGEQPAPPGPIERPKADRPRAEADRGLLLAILALQNNFIDRDMLLAAFNAWVADKSRALGQILVERGALSGDEHALLEALVGKHLKKYGDDPERSLAALGATASFRRDPGRIADRDLYASLTHTPLDRGVTSRFRILRLHAEGGLGQVSVALDEALHRQVALKEIQDRYADDAESRARFLLEAEITGNLEHPGIVPIYSLGHDDGRPFYVMQFIRGDTLKQAIERFHRDEVPGRDPGERILALRELFGRFIAACNAIAYAHSRGVLHRDLKPSNIILGKYGATLVVDWGLAKSIGRPEGVKDASEVTFRPSSASGSAETLTGLAIGTPQYMSPEQAAGRLDLLGTASDVYSLGATLYCLLTGRAPFEDRASNVVLQKVQRGDFPPPRQVKRGVAPALEAICLKAMALRPEDRYLSPRDLAEDIEHWLADESVLTYPEGWGRRLARWARHHRTWTQAGAAALLVVTLVSVGAAVLVNEARNQERAARGREDRLRHLAETRVAALRAEGLALLQKGQAALGGKDWQDAKLQLSKALATAAPERQLADLKAHAGDLLALADRRLAEQAARQRAWETYQRFLRRHDDAMSQGTLLTILGLPSNREAIGNACREALALYGVDAETDAAPALDEHHLSDQERAEITIGCFELLLLLAETVAQPPPHVPPDADRTHQAIQILDRAAKLGFQNQAYHLRRAHYWAQLGDPRREVEDLARATSLTPTSAVDYFLSGHEWVNRGDLPRAIRDFDHALRLQPDHFWAQYFSAVCYLKLQRPAEARTSLTAYLSRRPDFIWIYLLRGVACGELGELEAAEADFRKALELNADEYARYGIYVNRGIVRIRQEKFAEAVADLGRAIAVMPDQYQAYAALSQAYQAQKKWAEAIGLLDEAIRLEPTLAHLYRARARLNQERQDLDAALRDLEQVVRLELPDSPLAAEDHYERGQILYQEQRYQDVVRACDDALRIRPDHPLVHHLRAKALLKLQQYEATVRACDQYLERGKPIADIFRIRGRARERLTHYAGAVNDYTQALGMEPDADLLIHRGWAYGFSDAWKLALRDFEEAARRDPQNSDAYTSRGYARVKLGRYREAVADAEEALRRKPDTPSMMFNVACTFAQAVSQVEADAELQDRQALATHYRERTLEALRKTLDSLPADQRLTFWRDTILPDADLDPIRHSPEFTQLGAAYSVPAK